MLKRLYPHVTGNTRNFLLHLMLWVLLLSIPFMDMVTRGGEFDIWLLLRLIVALGLFYFNYFILVPKFLVARKLNQYLLVIVPLVFGLSYLTAVYGEFHPPRRFLQSPNPAPPDFAMRYIPSLVTFTLHALASTMSRLYIEWSDTSKKQLETATEKRAAELMFLKAQLNPHFFFNSLNTIYSLSIKKASEGPEAIISLSNLMRYVLYETDKDIVRLEDDLQYLTDYIELSKLRLTANNKVNFSVNGDAGNMLIPPLLFISFVENAFKHGAAPVDDTGIDISFGITPKQIEFRVANTIHKERTAGKYSGVGLENTLSRINLYFPNRNFFSAFERDGRYIVNLIISL
ncbi:sensor histidine kinase [Flavobacterium sp.]|uniref:sensor histidine kinase n=1 Tax=Flavobacterium sp. TaxID=239 RepID=UPI0011FFFEAF|nr:sensor histidine kinase [Flavobacterium sp.]RZJ72280.1 MAG: histidine kinase [Flavobacterium sp.]